MKSIVTTILLLWSFASFSQETNSLLGKWKACSYNTNDSTVKIDSSLTCTGDWNMEFYSNGKFEENLYEHCDGDDFLHVGKWKLSGNSLSLIVQSNCNLIYTLRVLSIVWINRNKWYYILENEPNIVVFYERIEE